VRSWRSTAGASLVALLALGACVEQRTEYRYRPGYMSDPNAPKEVTLADGTKVVFLDHDPADSALSQSRGRTAPKVAETKLGPDGKPLPAKVFEPRETLDDGTVVLRNLMPEHVVGNTMECFRKEEWKLVWDQLLAPETRTKWERQSGYDAFEKWCTTNRKSTMELLNRMRFNAIGSDVAMRQTSPGVMRATLAPHLWDQFQLRVVEFEQTKDGMKLLSIRPAP